MHIKIDQGESMKTINIGINGLGRIGRSLIRELYRRNSGPEALKLKIVAVNNPGKIDSYVHLLKYDSLHRHFNLDITDQSDTNFSVNNEKIEFFSERDPANINWAKHKVDIVLDSTGVFKDTESLSKHLGDTVKKVILCAPGQVDATFVMGINHETFDPSKHNIVSNASCTTNCLAPVAKTLNDAFGIENAFMTTVHAYTSDQNILDNSHKDLRRARAAALSMIPTSTGAAKATGLVIPELLGKLNGYAVRVPTADVSMVDLTMNLKSEVTIEEINKTIKQASTGKLKNILGYTEEELVSMDFMGRTESSIFDSKLTDVMDKKVARIVTWYDNEIGFSNRVLDLAQHIGHKTWA